MEHLNDDRVSWEPAPVHSGDTVHVRYQGLLKNSGADEVYLHCGMDGWNNPRTIRMDRLSDGRFSSDIAATANHELNLCFKDSANNWDNNSGWNWKIDVVR